MKHIAAALPYTIIRLYLSSVLTHLSKNALETTHDTPDVDYALVLYNILQQGRGNSYNGWLHDPAVQSLALL